MDRDFANIAEFTAKPSEACETLDPETVTGATGRADVSYGVSAESVEGLTQKRENTVQPTQARTKSPIRY